MNIWVGPKNRSADDSDKSVQKQLLRLRQFLTTYLVWQGAPKSLYHFFWKLSKIAENYDHSIDPCCCTIHKFPSHRAISSFAMRFPGWPDVSVKKSPKM
jgi:hypothetical protein